MFCAWSNVSLVLTITVVKYFVLVVRVAIFSEFSELAEFRSKKPPHFACDGSCICCTKFTYPTGALNRTASNEVMEELVKLNEEGTTIMMVTHDAKVAAKCSRVLYIVDGNIKGEYISPKDLRVKEKDRERLLNNWLLELGW